MNSDTGSVLGIISILVSIGGAIYAAINHKRLRCRCCGKNIDIQVDVDSTEATRKSGQFEKVDVKVHKPDEVVERAEPSNSIVFLKHGGRVTPA